MPRNIHVVYTCTNKKPHELYQVLHFKDLNWEYLKIFSQKKLDPQMWPYFTPKDHIWDHIQVNVLHFKDLWLTIIKFTHICVLKYILSENDIGFRSIFVCVGHIDVHGPVSYTRRTHLGACREDNIYSNKYNSYSLIFSNHIFFFNSEICFVKK